MAVPIAGCGGKRGFSWQSQMLVVWFTDGCSHGSPRGWLWGRIGGGSHGSPRRILCLGEAEFLMTVPDPSCGRRWYSHGSGR